MLAIDTNVIVRYLTRDDPEQSPRARKLIEGRPVSVPITVILEVEWVLRSAYGYGRAEIVQALRAFGGLPTVEMDDAAIVSSALDLAEKGMDFADALHLGKSAHRAGFTSFDRTFVKAAKKQPDMAACKKHSGIQAYSDKAESGVATVLDPDGFWT